MSEQTKSDPQAAVPRRLLEDVRKWAPPGNIMLMQAIDQLAQALADTEKAELLDEINRQHGAELDKFFSPNWCETCRDVHRQDEPHIGAIADAERPHEEEPEPSPVQTARRWTEVLCTKCGGNGVIKIPGGVSQCPRCDGRCYEPEPSPLAASPAPSEAGKPKTDKDDQSRVDSLS